jgi:hypothetical protein
MLGSEGDWEVWLQLAGDVEPPSGNTICIGTGATRNEAIADAVRDLEDVVEQLQTGDVSDQPSA